MFYNNYMSTTDKMDLGDRMKRFENCFKQFLPRRIPVIIRLDMRAGHSFTAKLAKPFAEDFHKAMAATCKSLAEQVSLTKLVYSQSDEISLLVYDDGIKSEPWFDNNQQKIVSLSACVATLAFNKAWQEVASDESTKKNVAMFDSRVFILPFDEVCNYFLWRQQDASKNSIQMLARSLFSHKSLQGLNGSQLQDKMMLETQVNWNDIATWQKRGFCVLKGQPKEFEKNGQKYTRSYWEVDEENPIFSQDREYVERFVKAGMA
jgi:tRNA(His) 5'-end guanylyltransferase